MQCYKRKPAIVTAQQWSPDSPIEGVKQTAPERGSLAPRGILRTQFGTFIVQDGDYIVSDDTGNKWVVEAARFADLYEPIGTKHTAEIEALAVEVGGHHRCSKCGGTMAHYRLKGYQCQTPSCPGPFGGGSGTKARRKVE